MASRSKFPLQIAEVYRRVSAIVGARRFLALLLALLFFMLGVGVAFARSGGADARLASTKYIGVAVAGNPDEPITRLAFHALMLDLTARGYLPTDLRPLFGQYGLCHTEVSSRQDSLLYVLRRSGSIVRALALLRVATDSVDYSFAAESADFYRETRVLEVELDLTVMAVPEGEKLFEADATTKEKIFRNIPQDSRYYRELPHWLVQRSVLTLLRKMPICSLTHQVNIRYRLPLVVYADLGFRTLHGEMWQKVLKARVDLAAGFFRSQFQLDLQLARTSPWESDKGSSLGLALLPHEGNISRATDTLFLGFVFDPTSTRPSGVDEAAGIASFLNNVCVMREMPATTDDKYWYTLNHARVILHEIAHMLGAVHVNDEESFLYPTDGFIGFRFDSLNVTILNGTRRVYGRLDHHERIRTFLPLVFASQSWPRFRWMLNVEMLDMVLSAQWLDSAGVRVRVTTLDTLGMDSTLLDALAGFRAFRRGEWPDARRHFRAAVERDPTYAEGFSYLERIALAEGDTNAAREYRSRLPQR